MRSKARAHSSEEQEKAHRDLSGTFNGDSGKGFKTEEIRARGSLTGVTIAAGVGDSSTFVSLTFSGVDALRKAIEDHDTLSREWDGRVEEENRQAEQREDSEQTRKDNIISLIALREFADGQREGARNWAVGHDDLPPISVSLNRRADRADALANELSVKVGPLRSAVAAGDTHSR